MDQWCYWSDLEQFPPLRTSRSCWSALSGLRWSADRAPERTGTSPASSSPALSRSPLPGWKFSSPIAVSFMGSVLCPTWKFTRSAPIFATAMIGKSPLRWRSWEAEGLPSLLLLVLWIEGDDLHVDAPRLPNEPEIGAQPQERLPARSMRTADDHQADAVRAGEVDQRRHRLFRVQPNHFRSELPRLVHVG